MEDGDTNSKNGIGIQRDEDKIHETQLLRVKCRQRSTSECSHKILTTKHCFSILDLRVDIHERFQLAGLLHDDAAGDYPDNACTMSGVRLNLELPELTRSITASICCRTIDFHTNSGETAMFPNSPIIPCRACMTSLCMMHPTLAPAGV